ncbi:Peptide methionine sulfoxide reductase MsrA 1 [Microbulbifer aggregans]|uniref:Peptide methionine sulfoxide reductase MsrA n=1 Tax=Microbulbifer aggregans TaxID=1769779 RepID=A0A1C9W7J0_9GAMM|nr:peptide-methionine (S)-S-oxide reductase MsrA [Microbulbifer aggregans]AOS97117.1 Peptide methionine sulfoxide reductase MsrA 1 [Microbulbifer aggregans]
MRRFIAIGLLSMAALVSAQGSGGNIQTAVFAGGCFWCMEPPYDKLDGVLKTTSGYSGGKVPNPTYEQVSGGGTGHAEVVQVTYDADKISYSQLLDVFWKNVDPLDGGGQFCDRGDQYRSAVFYGNAEEKRLAEASKQRVEQQLGKRVATQLVPEATFYPAEGYHQDYYQRNPVRYKYYRFRCGRDQRLEEVWGAGR